MENNKDNKNVLLGQIPTIYVYKNDNCVSRIKWLNRSNTKYEIVKEQVEPIGRVDTYVDFIHRMLNPQLAPKNVVYGNGRKLQPLNNTINEMKKTIDNATSQKLDFENELQKKLQEQLKLEQESKQESKQDSKGEQNGTK